MGKGEAPKPLKLSIYDNLVEFTHDGACRYSLDDGTIRYANQGFATILELDSLPQDLVGRKFCDLVECEEDFLTGLNHILEEAGELHGHEARLVTLQGDERWVVYDARIASDDETGERVVETVMRDITKFKIAEKQLENEADRLSATLMFIDEGVISTDKHGNILQLNKKAEEMTGWARSEALGKYLGEVLKVRVGAGKAVIEHFAQDVIQSCGSIIIPGLPLLVSKSGNETNVSVDGSCIYDRGGDIIGVVVIFRDMTEELRAEDEIKKSERRFHTLVDNLMNPLVIYQAVRDDSGKIIDFIPQYSNAAAREQIDPHITLKDDSECGRKFKQTLVDVVETGKPFTLDDYEFDCSIDGKREKHWFDIRISKFNNGFQAMWRDVTVRRLAQLKLKEEHARAERESARLRAVLDVLPVGVFIVDKEGSILETNKAASAIWMLSEEDLQNPEKFCCPCRVDAAPGKPVVDPSKWACHRAMLTGENAVEPNLKITCPNGSEKILSVYAAPLRDQSAQISGAICAQVDVTERYLAARKIEEERSLAEAERARLRTVLDVLPVGVFISNLEGRVIQTNRAASEIWMTGVEDLLDSEKLARAISVAKRPDGQPMTEADMPCNLAMRSAQNIVVPEVTLTFASGQRRILSAYGAPLRGTEGQVTGGVCVQVDITELQNALQQLRGLNATLEQRVAERTAEAEGRALKLRQLASALTQSEQRERRRLAQLLHDHLQQLLVGAKFNATILRGKLQDTNLVQIARQVEDLLSQSIEASRTLTIELSPQVLYDAGLAPAIEWLGRWMRENQGLTVDVHADPDAEPDAEDIRVLLFQSIRELLLNVVKHSGTHAAYVSLRCVNDDVEAVVEDRGGGISKDRLTAEHEGGFGLLSIRERLELIGGKMLIQTGPERVGTRIVIVAPSRHMLRMPPQPEAPIEVEQIPEAAPVPAPPKTGKIRVLLADDHEIVREGLAGLLLEEPDIEIVAEASDGQMALHLARRIHPDVIIMDVSMPRLSGVEATRKIKEEMPDIRIIVLSMHAEADMAAAMITAGASAYLTKGGPYDALITAIRAVPASSEKH